MLFRRSVLQSFLALYGFGEKTARRRPSAIYIGQPRPSR